MAQENRQLVRQLMVSINRVDGIWYRLARHSGVKVNTLSLLFALDDGQPRTQKQICEEWIIPKTTINTVVKECAAAGYVDAGRPRNMTAQVGREKLLRLTPAGQQYAQEVLRPFYQAGNAAMAQTLTQCPPDFIQDLTVYADCLEAEVRRSDPENPPQS